VGGNVLTVIFASKKSKDYSAEDLWHLYDSVYGTYLVAQVLLLGLSHLLYKKMKVRNSFISISYYFNSSQVAIKEHRPWPKSSTLMPICYALFSTIIGTQSVVQAKCLSELLQLTLKGENQLTNPFTYGVLAAWLLSTVYWVHRMNRALSKFPGLFVIPLLQVFWTSLAILTGSCFSI